MAAHPQALEPPLANRQGRRRDSLSAWPLIDRLAYVLCWAAGIGLCAVTAAIVLFMFVKGISYLRPSLFVQSPTGSLNQSQAGGFLDPIEGTLLLTALGVAIAAPIGVALAAWLSEYHRPAWLARAVESGVEMIAGAPSVVLAIFGLLVFSQGFLGFLSQRSAGGAVYGRSFFAAGVIMALLAIPLIVAATREGLAQLPAQLREASYALGKNKATTIRHVLLPAVRQDIASGIALGMGRIIGDTAIVVILLGSTLRLEGAGGVPILSTLRGTGSTLTAYVYQNSPAGEGNAAQKAYAAAFVLLMLVLLLNFVVTRLSSSGSGCGRMKPVLPPPVRRISVERSADRGRAGSRRPGRSGGAGNGSGRLDRSPAAARAIARRGGRRAHAHRVGVAGLRRALGRARCDAAGAPGRGAGPDRRLGVGQDDAAAGAQPPDRGDGLGLPGRADHARRPGDRRHGGHRPAPARLDGLPAAQPVSDEHLRERRLRPARGALPGAARG
jgi:phosphate transport system permease protein